MELNQVFNFNFDKNHINELEKIENDLKFETFNQQIALDLALSLIQHSKNYDGEIVLRISDEIRNIVIFQYVMETKTEKNIKLAMLKRNAVLQTGHCSLWLLIKAKLENQCLSHLFNNKDILPIGGAFPIYVGEKHVATISISGLHDGLDHELIVKTLYKFLNKEELEFTGKLY